MRAARRVTTTRGAWFPQRSRERWVCSRSSPLAPTNAFPSGGRDDFVARTWDVATYKHFSAPKNSGVDAHVSTHLRLATHNQPAKELRVRGSFPPGFFALQGARAVVGVPPVRVPPLNPSVEGSFPAMSEFSILIDP